MSLETKLGRLIHKVHLFEMLLNEPDGWTIRWGDVAVPAQVVRDSYGIGLVARFSGPEVVGAAIDILYNGECWWVSEISPEKIRLIYPDEAITIRWDLELVPQAA